MGGSRYEPRVCLKSGRARPPASGARRTHQLGLTARGSPREPSMETKANQREAQEGLLYPSLEQKHRRGGGAAVRAILPSSAWTSDPVGSQGPRGHPWDPRCGPGARVPAATLWGPCCGVGSFQGPCSHPAGSLLWSRGPQCPEGTLWGPHCGSGIPGSWLHLRSYQYAELFPT